MVDDSTLSLEFQTMLLKRNGFDVRGITSVSKLDEIDVDWPEAVLVDGNMPDATAPDACAAVRKRYTKACVLLVSGLEGKELRKLARECRADGFVSKGEDIERLPDVLTDMLERAISSRPIEDKHDQLRLKFIGLLPGRMAATAECFDNLAERRAEARRLVHTTKGEARLLGLAPVADAAKALEDVLKSDSEDIASMRKLLDNIEGAASE